MPYPLVDTAALEIDLVRTGEVDVRKDVQHPERLLLGQKQQQQTRQEV